MSAPLDARSASDLSSLLAPAPSIDWIEAGASNPQVMEGPFTAKSYGDFVDRSNATPSDTASVLDSDGFTGGYGKEWLRLGSNDLLIERVFEFNADSGAATWYEDLKSGTQRQSSYQETFATATIPDSFGAIMKGTSIAKQWRIYFRKANFMFVVHADSRKGTGDLEGLAVGQAKKEYDGAPASTIQLAAKSPTQSWLVPVAIGTAVFVVLLAVVVLVVVLIVSRRPSLGAPVASPIHMSPDGAYWWDGIRWHDARSDIPPLAQRSPDGAYWWDGRTWRLVGS